MQWVTAAELEEVLREAGFMRPKVEGGFSWVWRRGSGTIAWVYTVRYHARTTSERFIRTRLHRALSRLGPVEIRWAYADEADFYFLADLIEPPDGGEKPPGG